MINRYKLVVFVPVTHADIVREAMTEAGAGKIGNYSGCSFSSIGMGRFLPNDQANPYIGQNGQQEIVEEERIEVLCFEDKIEKIIDKMKKVHPYEEVAYDVYALENF